MRRDTLAAGARKAQFSVGTAKADDTIELKNVAPEEENTPVVVPVIEEVAEPKKIFRPLKGVLLVQRAEAKIGHGILITETLEQERPAEGVVIAAGINDQGISQGDYIVFGKYAGAEFRLNGETLLLMDVTEVKGTLENAPTIQADQDWTPNGCTAIGRA